MKVVFWTGGHERERKLAGCLDKGMRQHGDSLDLRMTSEFHGPEGDLGIIYGVKGIARKFIHAHNAAGVPFVFMDKSHTRQKVLGHQLFRCSVNGYMPIGKYFTRGHLSDRWLQHNRTMAPRRNGGMVLFAGSSQKYCDFAGLGDATEYAEHIIALIREHTDRPIIYRPKPSWRDAVPIDGTTYSTKVVPIGYELGASHCLVTHTSNAAIDAIMMGVPVIVLGDSIANPVCSHTLTDVQGPRWPTDEDRLKFISDLAYCQWSMPEMASGRAWGDIRGRLQ